LTTADEALRSVEPPLETFLRDLLRSVPEVEATIVDHFRDHGTMLGYVFLGSYLVPWINELHRTSSRSDYDDLAARINSVMEKYAAKGSELADVVAIGFIENVPRLEDHESFIRSFGPNEALEYASLFGTDR